MRLRVVALIGLLIAPALSGVGGVLLTAQESLGTYEDRIAVEDVMARYVWAVDSLDPEGYVAVFTAIVPHGPPLDAIPEFRPNNKVDELAVAKWKKRENAWLNTL